MSEGHQNIEVAHVLHERNAHHHRSGGSKGVEILEILEGVTLAIVAVATAWSSYQAAQWDGRSAESHVEATEHNVKADDAATLGGQGRLQDLGIFTSTATAVKQVPPSADTVERSASANRRLPLPS